MTSTPSPQLLQQYQASRDSCVLVEPVQHTQLLLTGADHREFLHKFCTADLDKLDTGQGSEAFVTSVQGKTVGYLQVLAHHDRLQLVTADGQAATLIGHLDRYLIREQVQFDDQTEQSQASLLVGPESTQQLEQLLELPLPLQPLDHLSYQYADHSLQLIRCPTPLDGYWLVANPACQQELAAGCQAAGIATAGSELWASLRIEAGLPEYGIDINEDNLPQEVDRNSQSISFTKGCYLGQETVARIDAMGHVNRLLTGLQLAADSSLTPGSTISIDDRVLARITSVAYSPQLQAPLALGYVRRDSCQADESIGNGDQQAIIRSLPLSPQNPNEA